MLLTILQGEMKISEAVCKLQKGHTNMTGIIIYTFQRATTPKAHILELWFLYSAQCIIMIYICIKIRKKENIEQFSNYKADTNIS